MEKQRTYTSPEIETSEFFFAPLVCFSPDSDPLVDTYDEDWCV